MVAGLGPRRRLPRVAATYYSLGLGPPTGPESYLQVTNKQFAQPTSSPVGSSSESRITYCLESLPGRRNAKKGVGTPVVPAPVSGSDAPRLSYQLSVYCPPSV